MFDLNGTRIHICSQWLLSSSEINHPLYAEDDLDYLYNQNGERIEKGVERKWDGKMWKITYVIVNSWKLFGQRREKQRNDVDKMANITANCN